MKPNFALNITDQSIGLLHRTSRGWLEVGTVRLDEADLGQALGYLRGSALGLEPRGLATKIVIPPSQLRYMTLAAPGPDAASRRAQIRAELEGKTPYAVDELVFDWSGTGETVQVAVVARETLEEAEAFACEHRLNPLSFVAIPEPGQFAKEPWFGPTAFAATMMQPGEKVERDQDPIQIVARTPLVREPIAAEPAPVPAPVAEPEPLPEPVSEPVRQEAPQPPEDTPPEPEVAVEAEAPPPEPMPVDAVAAPELAEARAEDVIAAVSPEPVQAPAPAPAVEVPDVEAPFIEVEPEPSAVPGRAAAASAGVTDTVIVEPPPAPVPRVDAPGARLEHTGAPGPTAVSLVAEARGGKKPPPKTQTKPPPRPVDPPVKRPPIGGQPRVVPNGAASADGEWPLDRVTAARTAARAETGKAGPVITATTIPMPRDRKSAPVRAVAEGGTDRVVPLPPRQGADAPIRSFGSKNVRQRGKPRYLGVILVALLLLLLAGVAAWSSLYLAGRSDEGVTVASAAAPEAASSPESGEVALGVFDGPAPGDDPDPAAAAPVSLAAADLPAPVETPEATAPAAAVAAAPAAQPEPLAAPEPAAPATTEAAAPEPAVTATTVAAGPEPATIALPGTEVVASRTPTADVQDEIFLARVDPRISTSDVAALTEPAGLTDPAPASQPEPPPFGTTYQFDAEGRIVPTPEGIVTPQGVRLVAGRPPLVPPERPAVVPVAAATAVPPAASASTAAPDAPAEAPVAEVFADPVLAGARPRARPEGLVAEPPAAAPVEEDAALSVAENARFSSLRPRARPPEVLARGIAEAEAVDAAVQSASASLATGIDATGSGSLLAVAVSRKPAPRPDNLNRQIEAAVSAAAAQASLVPDSPVIVAEPPVADDPVAVEIDEPELAAVAPNVPIRASVAKQATFTRAINLSKVNLIGVYGTSSNRYAMIRQANGRFVKVGVGDRVDGGRVAAISDRALQYVKNGRTHTLEIPRG